MTDSGHKADTAEIEITPAMIEAGIWALRDWLGDGKSDLETPEASLRNGVRAVLKASLEEAGISA